MSDNVDPLSGAYHRARQGYGIITGVLLLWVYVGVTMQAIPIVNVELNTPNAVPHVLALLLGYYLIRFTLEWYQCDKQRRCEIASRVDFAFAHGLGVFALGSYFLRHFLDVPVGEQLNVNVVIAGLLGFLTMLGGCEIYRYVREGQTDKLRLISFAALAVVPVSILVLQTYATGQIRSMLFGLVCGTALAYGSWRVLQRVM